MGEGLLREISALTSVDPLNLLVSCRIRLGVGAFMIRSVIVRDEGWRVGQRADGNSAEFSIALVLVGSLGIPVGCPSVGGLGVAVFQR